jgi:uncharacterized SAM-binding protein YcdF (DUF218 family)
MMTALRAGGAACVLLLLATAFTPLANRLGRRLAIPARIEPADAIVVLAGGAHPDGTLYESSLRRLVHGITLARRGLAPCLLVSGTRREVGRRVELVRALGLPPDVELRPIEARDTIGEARAVAAALGDLGGRRVLLVTDVYHLGRAGPLFARAGLDVLPAPVDDVPPVAQAPEARLALMRMVLREALARFVYRLSGHL